jgi:glutamate N-acetyltransferase / amino-acid N-acetyltransferase
MPEIAGVRLATGAAGIKYQGRTDVLVALFDKGTTAAGVFTRSKCPSAPVEWCRKQIKRGTARALVVNSGNANAFTGKNGREACAFTARIASKAVGCRADEVFLASTGVIGEPLDPAPFSRHLGRLAAEARPGAFADAARAIMTTDPFAKEAAAEASAPGGTFRVGGMAKGSGMIEPMMATMLGFITTDAQVAPALLGRALRAAVDDTFNSISVDGECSTNDCVFALANGASGVALQDGDYPVLVDALRRVCEPLAIAIVRGGEGATKLITIRVTGALTPEDAKATARAIANSPLVKTAVHGGDPNWGRLVAVAGRATRTLVLDRARVRVGPIELFSDGGPHDERAPEAAAYLKGTDIDIDVDLGTGGPGQARMWSCDLTAEYVRINAEYRT